jgi:hypothetical protein
LVQPQPGVLPWPGPAAANYAFHLEISERGRTPKEQLK